MLDSGANSSIVGPEGCESLKSLGYEIRCTEKMCIYTAKSQYSITGSIRVPCEFRNQIRFINFLYCPSVGHNFILGVDFWTAIEVKVQNMEGVWYCDSLESGSVQGGTPGVVSYEHLTEEQRTTALGVIEQFRLLANDEKLGRTGVLTQEIDTGDAEPTVQRYYPVSPSIRERM